MGRLRIAFAIVLPFYWLLMFVGTHMPVRALPGVARSDKLLHVLGYCGLAFLFAASWTNPRFLVRGVVTALVVIALYAVADEWTQRFVAGRQPDLWDWVADLVGCGCGLLSYLLFAGLWLRCTRALALAAPEASSETT